MSSGLFAARPLLLSPRSVTRVPQPRMASALVAALAFACLSAGQSPASAQSSTAREIVQPLPSPQVQRLNRALLELARRPRSVSAMLEAGDASIAVDDLDAAIGFYGNAAQSDPDNPRAKLGLARVYLRSGRPIEALPLLDEARANGAVERDVIGSRALAYDLLGDQAKAQEAYASALRLAPQDDEVRRRLSISQAISGNATGFQETLAPLIEARDVAAFRARAFGLAILGEQERAEGIVNSVMPPDLSARINPYLAYMPRLTPAQQAAAANLGIFPKAADIGREDPLIARFKRESKTGVLLEPAGEPLGSPTVREGAKAPVIKEVAAPSNLIQPDPEPTVVETDAGPSLPQVATREVGTPAQVEQQGQPDANQKATPEDAQPASVADAFADFSIAKMPDAGQSDEAVNIADLDVPRETVAQREPAPPEHPRRNWVQLATGRDVKALGFDWRRFARRAPDLLGEFEPHVTPWGRANRLLAGPIDSAREARTLVNALKDKGLETFTYTSPEGTEIKELKR